MPTHRSYLEDFISVNTPCINKPVNWSHPLGRGLVAGYLFSEGGGTFLRNVSPANPGNSIIANGTWSAYQRGTCLNFNGTSTQVPLSMSDSAWPINNFSVEIWFKRDASAVQNTLLDVGLTSGGWTISINATGNYVFGKGTNIGTSTVVAGVGVWEHAVITFNNLIATLYVNGMLSISGPLTAAFTTPVGGSRIGASAVTPANWFKGQIGMLRVWRRVLPDDAAFDAYFNPFDFLAPTEVSAHRHNLLSSYLKNSRRRK